LILDNKLIEGAPEDLMIEGAFDHLFDSSSVIFNSENGTFSFRGEERGTLFIEGNGSIRFWTEEAVKREGFSVSEVKTKPFIRVDSVKNNRWQLISQNSNMEFYSIYELMIYLREVNLNTI